MTKFYPAHPSIKQATLSDIKKIHSWLQEETALAACRIINPLKL